MIRIYHNPRCSKSREGLQLVENSGKDFEVIEYLKNPITKKELTEVLSKLGISPKDLVRKNEKIWKDDYRDKVLSDDAILEVLLLHPNLIERPIVVNQNKAVIGRPTELINTIL